MGSLSFSKVHLVAIAALFAACLFFRWQRDSAREDAEAWATKAHNAEASLAEMTKERAALLLSLESRNAQLSTIQQERRATASRLTEATRNAQTRSWYDTPLPPDIRRLLDPAADPAR